MFNSPFPFYKINYCKQDFSGETVVVHNYCFKGKQAKRYLVQVEEYKYSVFVVKFYLADHRNHSNRYNKLSNLKEGSRVIGTIGQIMKSIVTKNPFASFAFVGSPLPSENKGNTKRFQLYSKVVAFLISIVDFEHHSSTDNSAYLLLNRHNEEPELLDKIIILFRSMYSEDITLNLD